MAIGKRNKVGWLEGAALAACIAATSWAATRLSDTYRAEGVNDQRYVSTTSAQTQVIDARNREIDAMQARILALERAIRNCRDE